MDQDSTSRLKCFVMSPIGAAGSDVRKNADSVLKHLVRKALSDDFEISRGDQDANPGSITSQIVESILEADLVVADLSGYNPNVYYEVAIAHGYERPTVHLQHVDEAPAFDLKDMRLVQYDLSDPDALESAQKRLRESAKFAIENPDKVRTPLSNAKNFVQIGDSKDPVAQSILEVIEQVRSLRTEVRRSRGVTSPEDRGADIRGMRVIIQRATKRSALSADDFSEVVSLLTTPEFDDWARFMLEKVIGSSDLDELNGILFDEEVTNSMEVEPFPDRTDE
jgi:hypothetical protein